MKKLGNRRNIILFVAYFSFIATSIYLIDNYPADKKYLLGVKISNSLSWIVITCLVYFISAYFEELVYRDIIFNVVKEKVGTLNGILLSSLLFSFRHYTVFRSFYEDSVIISLVFVFFVATLFSTAYILSEKNIFVPTVIHAFWNFTSNFYTTKYFIQLNVVFPIIFTLANVLVIKYIKVKNVP